MLGGSAVKIPATDSRLSVIGTFETPARGRILNDVAMLRRPLIP